MEKITTGMREEAKEFIWEIQNFFLIQQDPAAVNQQQIEVEVGNASPTRSKWGVNLRVVNDSAFHVVFRLLEVAHASNSVFAKISIETIKLDKNSYQLQKFQQAFKVNEEVATSQAFLSVNYPNESVYNTLLDENGALNIKIKVSVLHKTGENGLQSELSTAVDSFKKDSMASLQKALTRLLDDTSSSDVKIVCSDSKELTAHRAILSVNSPVFESMLSPQGDFVESRNDVIQVDDISGKTMDILLTYIYTRELKSSWCHPDTIVEFTYAAGKYQLTDVLTMLDNVLGKDDNSRCNLMLLNLAQKLHLKKAEAQLMERIVKLTNAAKSSEDLFAIFGGTEEDDGVKRTLPSK